MATRLSPETGIILFATAYAAFACTASVLAGMPALQLPSMVAPRLVSGMAFALLAAVAFVLTYLAWQFFKSPAARPTTGEILGAHRRAAIAYIFVILFLISFSTVKITIGQISNFSWDHSLVNLDSVIHFGTDSWLFYLPITNLFSYEFIDTMYGLVWDSFMLYLPLFVLLTERHRTERARFFVCFFSAWVLIGNIAALGFLSAGPAFYLPLTGSERFLPLTNLLERQSGETLAAWGQAQLWLARETGRPFLGGGISAFPSVHLALATLTALYLGRRFGLLGWLVGLPYLALIQAGSVLLAWHYAVDGYVSMVVMTALWILLGPSTRAGRTAEEPVPQPVRVRIGDGGGGQPRGP